MVIAPLAGLAGLAIAAAASAASADQPVARVTAGCSSTRDVEAVIDDSGSMADTDSGRMRVQAMDLLINALDAKTDVGAIEFGSSSDPATPAADVVFPAEPVGPNAAAMKAALDSKIQADAGGTDYDSAFKTARAANPGARARIFLTDGGHNVGPYADAHLNPAPQRQTPTYVVGFGSGLSGGEDQARLAKIAADTGGRYFPLHDSSQLQSVMNQIETVLTCQSTPRTFNDSLARGRSKAHGVSVGANAGSAQVSLSWSSPLDRFSISRVRIVRRGKVVARPARARRLKITQRRGSTFTILKLSHLVKGTLRFTLKATRVGSLQPRVALTTQVSQRRRR